MNMKLDLKRITVNALTLISTASSPDRSGVHLHLMTSRSSFQLTFSIIFLRFVRQKFFKKWMIQSAAKTSMIQAEASSHIMRLPVMEVRVPRSVSCKYVLDLLHWSSTCLVTQADVACRKGLCIARGLSIGLHVVAVSHS